MGQKDDFNITLILILFGLLGVGVFLYFIV